MSIINYQNLTILASVSMMRIHNYVTELHAILTFMHFFYSQMEVTI